MASAGRMSTIALGLGLLVALPSSALPLDAAAFTDLYETGETSPGSEGLRQRAGDCLARAWQEAHERFETLRARFQEMVDTHKELREAPAKGDYEALIFRWDLTKTAFRTSEWLWPTPVQPGAEKGLALLAPPLLDLVNAAAMRAYDDSCPTGSPFARAISSAVVQQRPWDTTVPGEDLEKLYGQYEAAVAQVRTLLNEAKAHHAQAEANATATGKGRPDRSFKSAWEGFTDRHDRLLDELEELLSAYRIAALRAYYQERKAHLAEDIAPWEEWAAQDGRGPVSDMLPPTLAKEVSRLVKRGFDAGWRDHLHSEMSFRRQNDFFQPFGDYSDCYGLHYEGRLIQNNVKDKRPIITSDGTVKLKIRTMTGTTRRSWCPEKPSPRPWQEYLDEAFAPSGDKRSGTGD